MDEKSRDCRGDWCCRSKEVKSCGALIGVVDCCASIHVGAVCFGLSWLKISASLAKAMMISVPNDANGDDGAGFSRMRVRSFAVAMAKSADDVAGIVTLYGKNSTVLLCLVPLVLGT